MTAPQVAWPRRLYWRVRSHFARAKAAARVRAVRRNGASGDALSGKVVVITGAGAGIGRALARRFARAGARCVLVTIKPDEGAALVRELTAEGYPAELIVADVTSEKDVRNAVARIAHRYPGVDVLINNAGVYFTEDRETRASALTDDLLQKTLAVNLFGVVHMSREVAPLIPPGGRIINVSSVLGRATFPFDGMSAAYRVSKAALNSYTQSLSAEMRSRGIMVDCLHPGWVKTGLGGPGAKVDPEDATDTALLLASRPASPLTGLFWEDCGALRW